MLTDAICPVDLHRHGGVEAYTRLIDTAPERAAGTNCVPASESGQVWWLLARVQQADGGGQAHAVSVQQAYRQVLEELMPLADAKRIDIGVIDTGDMLVCASVIDLETVLNNLVGNAIAYTPEGGRIDLVLQPDGTQAIVVVADNGPGIEELERERVFEPFYRILGNDQPGAGLGLAIVRAICERIGATITLSGNTQAANTGLRVEIRLPAVTAGRQSDIS